jgi:hypothetical protein
VQSQQCPGCGMVVSIPDELAGRWVTCQCGTSFAAASLPDEAEPFVSAEDLLESPRPSILPVTVAIIGVVTVALLAVAVVLIANREEPQLAKADVQPPQRPDAVPHIQSQPQGGSDSSDWSDEGKGSHNDPPSKPPTVKPPTEQAPPPPSPRPQDTYGKPESTDANRLPRPLLITAILNSNEFFARDGDRSLWIKEFQTERIGEGQTVSFDGRFEHVETKSYTRPNGPPLDMEVYKAVGEVETTLVKGAPPKQTFPPPSRGQNARLPKVPPPNAIPLPLPDTSVLNVIDVLLAFAQSENEAHRRQSGEATLARAKGLCECLMYSCGDASKASEIAAKLTIVNDMLDSFTGADRKEGKELRRLYRGFMSSVRSAQALAQAGDEVTASRYLQRAKAQFKQLKKKYPDSHETEEAENLLNPP